jgi:hypothetical protein
MPVSLYTRGCIPAGLAGMTTIGPAGNNNHTVIAVLYRAAATVSTSFRVELCRNRSVSVTANR